MQIGIIGLGRVGGNMSRRLIKAGHHCIVFDANAQPREALATFRRKIGGFMNFDQWRKSEARRNGRRGLQAARSRAQTYGPDCFAMARPMLMRLSAITPRPTQRFMPALPL